MSDFVKESIKRANTCYEYWQPIYDKARDDLFFQSDDPYAQWNQKDADARRKSGRPVLTIDHISQFVNQVSNDVRMNTPSIDVIPAGGSADIETAEILQGIIKQIEYKSNADDAYDNAVNFAIKCGIGYIRIDHDYEHEMSFDQELYIERVVNPFSILFDHNSIKSDGSDAMYCYILEKMDMEEYKEKYPDASTNSFTIASHYTSENTAEEITLAELFYIEEEEVTLLLNGNEIRILEKDEDLFIGAKTRKSKKRTVRRYKMNGSEILEETTFPGDYIPIVPVYGEESWQDGKRHLMSLIRRSKDSQRMFNFWASIETELLMRAPKSAIIAAEGTTEDYASDYLNPDKAAVLRYKQTDSENRPAAPPNFVPPPQIPAGIVNARMQTTQDIRATMGLYDSFLGQQDNAISGVAIKSRQGEGNRAVFHFADNLVRSITQIGRILLSAIPEIYDTPRIVSIIGKEETNDVVGINGMYVEGQDRNYSLGIGYYNVKVTTGASFSTMRQEASEAYQQIIAAQPQLMQVMGDLLFKYMDFPGAQAISERIKRTMDPNILDDEQDPQVAALQGQNEQLKQAIEVLQGTLAQYQQALSDKQAQLEIKTMELVNKAANDERNHMLNVRKQQSKEAVDIANINLKQQGIELDAYDAGLKTSKQATEQRRQALKEVAELAADVTEDEYYD